MKSLEDTLSSFILSVSGWRAIFALDQKEESLETRIPASHAWAMIAAGYTLGEFYRSEYTHPICIAIGRDTRPTGARIEESLLKGLLLHPNIEICYLGVCAITEIMAYTSESKEINGFIYVSASHNPAGYNGLKMGLSEGGCLSEEKSDKLLTLLWAFIRSTEAPEILKKADTKVQNSTRIQEIMKQTDAKEQSLELYEQMARKIVLSDDPSLQKQLIKRFSGRPLGIIGEMNGSARYASIDPYFFNHLSLKTEWHNIELGEFAHGMVPEGDSLNQCSELLLLKHTKDPSYLLGYVPDCDGDRGNLVFYNEKTNLVQNLEAQEGFALVVIAELSFHLFRRRLGSQGEKRPLAVVVNDATSLRVEEIVSVFGGEVFRAEVGEANVVSLADLKRAEGYDVVILGEGSNGGSILPPSRVRDPLYTVVNFAKLLCVNEIYDLWFTQKGLKLPAKRTIANLLLTLPAYCTTSAFEKRALVSVTTKDQAKLKKRYLAAFEMNWLDIQQWIPKAALWMAISYEGTTSYEGVPFHNPAATGGFKIVIKDADAQVLGSLWMRRSKTEPVFRTLVDIKGGTVEEENGLLEWHKALLQKVD